MTHVFPAHGGNLNWAAERYDKRPEEFLDFSSNVNPLGPPPAAMEAAMEALSRISRYPDPDGDSLKPALSEYLGVAPELIMLGNGSTELIYQLCRHFQPRRVTVVAPAFSEYECAARACGATVFHHLLSPDDSFRLDTKRLARAARVDMTFICNPASPSGILYPRDQILRVLEACREGGGIMVMDESFMGFCSACERENATLLEEAGGDNLVIVSTLTKLFALAGVRGPGYLIAKPALVSGLEERSVPWRVNVVALTASAAALGDGEYMERTREVIGAWREDLERGLLENRRFEVYPSRANFLLLKIKNSSMDAAGLADALGRRGILIRYCGNFKALDSRFLRVAVLAPRDNSRLLEVLGEVLI